MNKKIVPSKPLGGSKEQHKMYLQVICTELARENLMLFPHVLLKLLKPGEDFRLWAATAYR